MSPQGGFLKPISATTDRLAQGALFASVVSLLLVGSIWFRLDGIRRETQPFVEMLGELSVDQGRISTSITVPAGVPLEFDVPIRESLIIRVDTVLPIRTRVTVPIRSPVGNFDVPVPIRADIPVRLAVPITVAETIHVRTRSSRDIRFPVELGRP